MSAALADAAAFLAPQWPCFPCGADKKPITENGFYDASNDEAAVRSMFARPGARLIGVPTGPVSNLAVIDLDVKDGRHGLEWLAANEHRLPRTRRHRTMSGGLHLLFRYPAGRTIRNRAGLRVDGQRIIGVDARGEGGYIIAPPSPGYSIADDAMPAEMPAWLLDLLDPPKAPSAPRQPYSPPSSMEHAARYGGAALDAECRAVAGAAEGTRNITLNNAALKLGGLVAAGALPEAQVRAELRRAALHAGLEPRETDATIQSGLSAGMQTPRQIPERQRQPPIRVEIVPPEPPPYDEPPAHAYAEPDIGMDNAEARRRADAAGAHLVEPAGFPTLTLDEIEALPPPAWLVEGLLVEASNASLIAPPKSLKSFIALDWSLHIAYGMPWLGRPVRQCGVLYVAGEGVGGMGRRIKAWRAFHGVEDRTAPFRLVAVPFRITNPQHIARLIATAKAAMEADGWAVGLVVNDTLARSMAGADENSAQDMGTAVSGMDEVRTGVGCAMLSVHHTGKDVERGARGSSALLGAVDTEITVKRDEFTLTVKVTAQKDAEEGDEIILQAKKIGLTGSDPAEGEPTSLVLVEADAGHSPSRRPSGRLSGDQQRAMEILADVLASHGEPGHPGCPAGVPSVPEEWWRQRFYERAKPGAEQDAKKRAFRRAADALVGERLIGMGRGRIWLI